MKKSRESVWPRTTEIHSLGWPDRDPKRRVEILQNIKRLRMYVDVHQKSVLLLLLFVLAVNPRTKDVQHPPPIHFFKQMTLSEAHDNQHGHCRGSMFLINGEQRHEDLGIFRLIGNKMHGIYHTRNSRNIYYRNQPARMCSPTEMLSPLC